MRVPVLVIGVFGAAALALALTAASPSGGNGTVEELLAADRAFAQAAAADGLDGWMSFMTADAARMPIFGSDFVAGDAAIRALDGPLLSSAEQLLTWMPESGHLFDDGRHGFTSGTYEVRNRAGGASLDAGRYLTFWRLTEDGWRVAFDTGVARARP